MGKFQPITKRLGPNSRRNVPLGLLPIADVVKINSRLNIPLDLLPIAEAVNINSRLANTGVDVLCCKK